ncbi:hypothetical protein [Tsukamurella paurometabola]|uniref:PASTA domain-containing protein n=1 Tax=Tsukamurella paurometabola TaxID=2061 RepID=A0ABS5NG79_TSUPA|nr:hypothetical protein [Tsukamurella paurometabola]MBS4103284.1 hypothetical protein [Tsukamurella paurometabola]
MKKLAGVVAVVTLLAGCSQDTKEAVPTATVTTTTTTAAKSKRDVEVGMLASQFNLSEFQAGTLYTLTATECYKPKADGTYSADDLASAAKILTGITPNPPRAMQTWLVVNSHGVGCESKSR